MKKLLSELFTLLLLLALAISSCSKGESEPEPEPEAPPAPKSMSPGKQIVQFTLINQNTGIDPRKTGVIDSVNRTITFTVEDYTAFESLNTEIILAPGHSISPASGTRQDFTNPVIYTITKPDGTTTTWNVNAGIVIVKTDITKSTVWRSSKVYMVEEWIQVNNDAVLTIQPGAVVKFTGSGISVGNESSGTLIAAGTQDKPIIFTSKESQPAPGDWEFIAFRKGTRNNSILSFCQIQYGGWSEINGAVDVRECEITINNCIIENSKSYGISVSYWNNRGSFVACKNNTFKNTAKDAIIIHSNAVHTIGDGNTFFNAGNIFVVGDYYSESNRVWNKHSVPYLISGTFNIDGSLTIAPGATFKVYEGGSLDIGYNYPTTFIADGGSADTPITFTSETTTAGDWKGINIYEKTLPATKFNHCIIEYAGVDNMGAIQMIGPSSISFTNSILRHSAGYGINCDYDAGFGSFSNNTITNCGNHVIRINAAYLPSIGTGNILAAQTGKGIEIVGGYIKYTSPAVWRKQTVDYYMSSFEINGDLTIEAGTRFLISREGLISFGRSENTTVTAIGTPGNKITFTSASASPADGDWRGCHFYDKVQAGSILDYCIFQYTGYASSNALYLRSQFTISNTSILNHSGTVKAIGRATSPPLGNGNNFSWTLDLSL